MKKYFVQIQVLMQSGLIRSNCNAIQIINTSTSDIVKINGLPIQPGQSLSINGNANEIDVSDYTIELGTDPQTCFIITKFYK